MFLSDKEYERTLHLLDKELTPGPLLQELSQWSEEEYRLKIHDYICDTTNNGLTRLKLVVWDYGQQNKLKDGANYNPAIQRAYAEKFASLARKYNVHEAYHEAEDIFVCGDTIKDQIISKGISGHREELEALKKGDIWRIHMELGRVHIFYETDAQAALHEKDGTNEMLRKQIHHILSRDDKYHVFSHGVPCVFTSKQTLDEKYQGNMYFYLL